MAEGNKPTPVAGEGATASAGVLVEALRRLEQANDAVAAATTRERYLTDLADVQPALLELDDARAIARQALSASTATAASDGETLGPLWRKVQQVHTDAMSHDWSVDSYRSGMAATLGLSNTDTPDRFGEGYRAGDYEKAYFERGMFAAYAWMVTKRRGEQLSDAVVDHAWDHRDEGMGPTECLPVRAVSSEL